MSSSGIVIAIETIAVEINGLADYQVRAGCRDRRSDLYSVVRKEYSWASKQKNSEANRCADCVPGNMFNWVEQEE